MNEIVWTETMPALPHDPDAVEVYRWDWSAWLDGEETLEEAEALAEGVTAEVTATGGATVDVRVSGGAIGQRASVTVRATSTGGRVQDRTVRFAVRER